MNFNVYAQLKDGTVHVLNIKPLTNSTMARDAVLSAKAAVAELGERAIIDCCEKTTRKTYQSSLGVTSIWRERCKT